MTSRRVTESSPPLALDLGGTALAFRGSRVGGLAECDGTWGPLVNFPTTRQVDRGLSLHPAHKCLRPRSGRAWPEGRASDSVLGPGGPGRGVLVGVAADQDLLALGRRDLVLGRLGGEVVLADGHAALLRDPDRADDDEQR